MTNQIPHDGAFLPAALRTGAIACALAAGTAAHAADELAWKFSGYGTLGAVHASTRSADYTSTILRTNGAGASERWSPDVDSRLGAQLDVSQGRWSAVLQVVSEQGMRGNYRPQIEWANVKYQVTPDLAVRVGRIALPVFLAADYRKVGYALPWVRTPVEVYGALPLSSSDGVDATWRWNTGALRHTTQALYGRADTRVHDNHRLRARGIAGLSHAIEQGPLSGRASILSGKLSTGVGNDVFGPLRAFGPRGAEIAARYALEDKRVAIVSAGLSYDPGQWFASAEIGRTHTRSLLGQTTAMYVGGGYRVKELTPYLGYARVRAHGAISDPGLPLDALPPQLQAPVAMVNAGLNFYLATIPVQSTASAGLRWDLLENAALKAQYDRVRPTGGSRGTLINRQADFVTGQTVHVASVSLDFVF